VFRDHLEAHGEILVKDVLELLDHGDHQVRIVRLRAALFIQPIEESPVTVEEGTFVHARPPPRAPERE